MQKETQAELLPPIGENETELPMLRVTTPLESLKNFFDTMKASQERAIYWAKNTLIDSPKSRDEARSLRISLKAFAKKMNETRLQINKPVDEYLSEFKQIVDEVIKYAEEGVAILDQKGVAYAQECKRLEDEQKAKALAERRAEEARILAEQKAREAEEEKLRAQEAEQIARAKKEAEKAAKKAGDDMTARMQAEEAAKAAAAKIEAERAARDKAEADRRAEEQARADAAQAKMAQDMAKATGVGKTKGVKNVWVIEITNDKLIPEQFKTYDPKKAKAYVEAGLSNETDENKIIPGLRCYKVLTGSGR